MPDAAAERQKENNLSLNEKLRDVGKIIDRLRVGSLTTIRGDGYLVSRPMHVAKRDNADLYLVTNNQSHKVEELHHDYHVSMSFYDQQTREWLSISGKAEETKDKKLIEELYNDDLKAWFGDNHDGKHDGTPRDPRISIILVKAHSITCSIQDESVGNIDATIHKAAVKGEIAKVASLREISSEELQKVRAF